MESSGDCGERPLERKRLAGERPGIVYHTVCISIPVVSPAASVVANDCILCMFICPNVLMCWNAIDGVVWMDVDAFSNK